jgi:hypothetical protein
MLLPAVNIKGESPMPMLASNQGRLSMACLTANHNQSRNKNNRARKVWLNMLSEDD